MNYRSLSSKQASIFAQKHAQQVSCSSAKVVCCNSSQARCCEQRITTFHMHTIFTYQKFEEEKKIWRILSNTWFARSKQKIRWKSPMSWCDCRQSLGGVNITTKSSSKWLCRFPWNNFQKHGGLSKHIKGTTVLSKSGRTMHMSIASNSTALVVSLLPTKVGSPLSLPTFTICSTYFALSVEAKTTQQGDTRRRPQPSTHWCLAPTDLAITSRRWFLQNAPRQIKIRTCSSERLSI